MRRCLPGDGETIRKSRFTDEQIVKVPREADAAPVSEVVKKYRVQEQTLYVWRKRVGTMTVPDRAGREAAEWSRSPWTPTWSCQLDEAARRAPSFTCGAPLTGYQRSERNLLTVNVWRLLEGGRWHRQGRGRGSLATQRWACTRFTPLEHWQGMSSDVSVRW